MHNMVKINMILFNHSTDEKADSDTTLTHPRSTLSLDERETEREWATGMASRTPEKTPHVTSSAAIAPGCLSAQWGKEKETGRETEGQGQE